MRRALWTWTVAIVLLTLGGPIRSAFAEPSDEELRQLREENARMREQLDRQGQRLDLLEASGEEAEGEAKPQEGMSTVLGGIPIRLSGFLKADMLWNNARVDSTSAPRMSKPGQSGSDDQFTATVQNTRLALGLGPIDVGEESVLGGYVELDFFNLADSGNNNFNNNQLRTRQLYIDLDVGPWSILTGQAWDLFSPLNVSTLNTNGNYWFGGNGGFRRPQLQVARSFEWASKRPLTLKGSVNANIGKTTSVSGDTSDSGRDAGWPVLEAAIEQAWPLASGRSLRLGAAGLYGEEDLKGVASNIEQWGVGAYLVLPLFDCLTLSAEIQHGENLDAFLMGSTGINTLTGDAIEVTSGWLQATLTPLERLSLNLLFGLENPNDGDLADGSQSRNLLLGGNVQVKVFDHLTWGFEYIRFDTEYDALPDGTAHLVWTSLIFDF